MFVLILYFGWSLLYFLIISILDIVAMPLTFRLLIYVSSSFITGKRLNPVLDRDRGIRTP